MYAMKRVSLLSKNLIRSEALSILTFIILRILKLNYQVKSKTNIVPNFKQFLGNHSFNLSEEKTLLLSRPA